MWKTVGTTLKYFNVLQLQGEGPKLMDSGSQCATYAYVISDYKGPSP